MKSLPDHQAAALIEAIAHASESPTDGNLLALGRIVDGLRRRGWRYQDVYELAHNLTGVGLGEWETLMQDIDNAEARQ